MQYYTTQLKNTTTLIAFGLYHRSGQLLHFLKKNSQIKIDLHNSKGVRYNI